MSKHKASTIQQYKLVIDEWFANDFHGGKAWQVIHSDCDIQTGSAAFTRIVKIPEIQEYINERYEKAAKKLDVSIDGILHQLKLWVSYDITDTLLLSPEELKSLPIALRRLITKYKVTESTKHNKETGETITKRFIEVEFVSKEKAMEMINRHIGFYEADNRQRTNTDLSSLSNDELLERVRRIKKLSTNDPS